jgi:hypothetical protein
VIDEEGKIVWQTNTGGKGKDAYLELMSNRDLIVAVPDQSMLFPPHYRTLWQAACMHLGLTYGLQVGESLRKGEFRKMQLTDKKEHTLYHKTVRLIFEQDGNLELRVSSYQFPDEFILMKESKTKNIGEYVVFEPKKGLVIYDKNGKAIWHEGKSQDDYKKLTQLGYLTLEIGARYFVDRENFGKISIQDGKGAEFDSFWDWKW